MNLKDALQNLDDNPHELNAYHSHDRMEVHLRAQWQPIFDMFGRFRHMNTPYTTFWDNLRDLLYVFPDPYRGYKPVQFEEEKTCEGIVVLLLNPGKDNNGEKIDLDVHPTYLY